MRVGPLIAGFVVLIFFGFLADDYYPAFQACNSFAGQIYQFLGGQDCNTVYAIFYLSVVLIVVGLILVILGAFLSEPAPTPQVIYVQQPAPVYGQSPYYYTGAGQSYPQPRAAQPNMASQSPTSTEERFCPTCGAKNLRTSAYCEGCGRPLPPRS